MIQTVTETSFAASVRDDFRSREERGGNLTCQESVAKLMKILQENTYTNGAIIDFYDRFNWLNYLWLLSTEFESFVQSILLYNGFKMIICGYTGHVTVNVIYIVTWKYYAVHFYLWMHKNNVQWRWKFVKKFCTVVDRYTRKCMHFKKKMLILK